MTAKIFSTAEAGIADGVQHASLPAMAMLSREISAAPKMTAAAMPADEFACQFLIMGVAIDAVRELAVFLLVAAPVAVFVALMSALEARRYDIAVMRIAGASRIRGAAPLLGEAWLLAFVVLLLGAGLGIAAVRITWTSMVPSRSFALSAWTPELVGAVAISFIVATIAALIPAWRAGRMNAHSMLAEP